VIVTNGIAGVLAALSVVGVPQIVVTMSSWGVLVASIWTIASAPARMPASTSASVSAMPWTTGILPRTPASKRSV
jgi:hypothetical protein